MKRLATLVLLLVTGGCLITRSPCGATFAFLTEPVPLERLLKNVGRYVHDHPGDAAGHYALGRLHSMRFAGSGPTVNAMKDPKTNRLAAVPTFPYNGVIEERDSAAAILPAAARQDLCDSIREYRRAAELDGKKSHYWLGLGWMIEQGMPFSSQVDAPFLDRPVKAPARTWADWALAAYRHAYALTIQKDQAKKDRGPVAIDEMVSLEAGEGMLRLFRRRPFSWSEALEAFRVRRAVQKMKSLPRWITPIIFSPDAAAPASSLLEPSRTVSFDLRGDGLKTRWTWVGPRTGLLIWDPQRSDKIISGRQLFGSVTWSMFWQDGYAPLAALDDNGNGWLEGKELDGIAVWFDRNGNGVFDPGEVESLADLGIERIALHPSGSINGMIANRHGLQRRDGSFLPTYDWVPTGR